MAQFTLQALLIVLARLWSRFDAKSEVLDGCKEQGRYNIRQVTIICHIEEPTK